MASDSDAMSTSPKDLVGFRTLQAIHDLRHLCCLATDETLQRIGAGISNGSGEAKLRGLIFEQGCKLTEEDAKSLHTALLLAATMPEDDHAAFVVSTAVLLADRLQYGAGQDDLYWHWDAFQSYYDLVEPAGRAAILQGYLRAHRDDRVNLSDPPHAAFCTTLETKTALSRLKRIDAVKDQETIDILTAALSGGDTFPAAQLWASAADLPPQSHIAAFRHLYEANESWDPYPTTKFSLRKTWPDLIPVLPE